MRSVTITLPDSLYSSLEHEAATLAAVNAGRYSAVDWATDCVASELAARRLLRIEPLKGARGPCMTSR